MSNRSYKFQSNNNNSFMPEYMGTNGCIATHSNLSAQTAFMIINNDNGNAFDAAAGAMLVESLVNPQMFGLGGEAIMIIKPHNKNVTVLNGNTKSPKNFNFINLLMQGYREVPDTGIHASGVPGVFSSIINLLKFHGSLTFNEISKYAYEYAKNGFPIHPGLIHQEGNGLKDLELRIKNDFPNTKNLYFKNGKVPEPYSIQKNTKFADFLNFINNYENKLKIRRVEALEKLHQCFYKGDIANTIIKYSDQKDGFLKKNDFENFSSYFEKPISKTYGEHTIYKTDTWGQGVTSLMMLAMSQSKKIYSLDSEKNIHQFIEILKLVFADREMYFSANPMNKVKANHLIQNDYLNKRLKLISEKASNNLIPGDPINVNSLTSISNEIKPWGSGTVHIDIIDNEGNAISCTPSGGWLKANDVVKDLGFPLNNRLMTFYMSKPEHINFALPEMQPRTTLSPTLCLNKKNKEILVCGTMGGDAQDQWQSQFLMNYIFSNKSLTDALNMPRISSEHFPAYFQPHYGNNRQVLLEERLKDFIRPLTKRGHKAISTTDWSEGFLLCARKKDKIFDAYADIRSYKSQIFQAQALAW
ncbi:gamma-glutamyltransferase [Alphaproteobacteria bacterium]|nr:gamma-glutamyltransferase [Alphaproteobacteria bacterium]